MNSDEAIKLSGVGSAAYTDVDQIVKIAVEKQCQAVLPGYGFLSENCDFAALLKANGIIFAGPSPETIELFGLKHLARDISIKSNTPVVPGSGLLTSVEQVVEEADKIGYPVMLKLSAGGGGMGLKVCRNVTELKENFIEVKSRGETLFKNGDAFLEKFIEHGRHIEIQIFGNGNGEVVAFGERECSLQRRHQKVIEESPSPFICMPKYNQADLRRLMCKAAEGLGASVNYKSAGTVEFIVDDDTGNFYFLEANVRLQVEHPVTESIYKVDLVKLMLMQAEYEGRGEHGIPLSLLKLQTSCETDADGILIPQGHAIECRVYAENPIRNFQPSPGILHEVEFYQPDSSSSAFEVRIDHWIATGSKISPYFDPLLAKIIVWSKDRETSRLGMIEVLSKSKIHGPPTNVEYLSEILKSSAYCTGQTLTSFLEKEFAFHPRSIEFVESGAYTTIQDLPGRQSAKGGVPLSGPSDPLSLQMANIVVGNDPNMEGFEIMLRGPKIKFHYPAVVAVAGGLFELSVDDVIVPMYTAITIPAGSSLSIGESTNSGAKCYLAIKGGLPDVALYLGSKSCTPTLGLGGHQGRTVLPGDCLMISEMEYSSPFNIGYSLPTVCRPNFDLPEDHVWKIRMLKGPHDSPEICSDEGLDTLCNTIYKVNLNSNRGAQRLDGPSMQFSRATGGDGGLHPSNILEYPVATNCLSAVGNQMVLYGLDGATMSGFVALTIPIMVDWWKFGQGKVNAGISFEYVSYNDAMKLYKKRLEYVEYLTTHPDEKHAIPFNDALETYEADVGKALLYQREASDRLPLVSFRQAGEKMIVIDFGTDHFTLLNNGRQHALELMIEASTDKELKDSLIKVESTSGAMAVTFDPLLINQKVVLEKLVLLEASMPPTDELKVPSTIYKLPLTFDHASLKHCIDRYMHSQRPYASYLPDNTKFVMEASCISTVEEFKDKIIGKPEVVTAVSFLCANTLLVHPDPRMRFMTQKYNPARTFTPRGAIGTGSVSQSIYSVDSPGGYMIWGMTLPNICWDTFGRLKPFKGNPWFLKNFDQIEFYEVSEDELNSLNDKLITGELEIETVESVFDFKEYNEFLSSVSDEAAEIKRKQIAACEKLTEKEQVLWDQWMEEKAQAKASKNSDESVLNDPNNYKLEANMAANVFKINSKKDDVLKIDDIAIILEAMKMEIAVRVSARKDIKEFKVLEVIVDEGDMVNPGDCLAILQPIK